MLAEVRGTWLLDLAGLLGDYDQDARWGRQPVANWDGDGLWRQTNASRYVRMFQSRRSLLAWKVFGQRLDGWTNASHPTESVPGNEATLPPGADRNAADLDFTGTIMPPPPALPLTAEERLTIVRWIDLGAPIDLDASGYGWFLDDLKPALEVSVPRAGMLNHAVTQFRFAFADANSGINAASLSVTSDQVVNGRPAGAELASLALPASDGIWTITLSTPIAQVTNAHVRVSIRDVQGNVTRVDREFSVLAAADGVFLDGFE